MKVSFKMKLPAILLALLCISPVTAQEIVFEDQFDGSGFVDQTLWRLPSGGDGSFYGRTQAKTDLSTDYPVMSGGTMKLQMNTYLDDGNGSSAGVFAGAELITKRNFALAGGLRFEVRARVLTPVSGIVGGIFLYDVQRLNSEELITRDEVDFEVLTNDTSQAFTNMWNDGTFVGDDSTGSGAFVTVSGYDATQFHDYRVDWLPGEMNWYIDGELVRTETDNVPDDPMRLHMNYWVPDSTFVDAYDANLQPATSSATGQVFEMEVDSVVITRLNTESSENMMPDGDFEDTNYPYSNYSFGGSANGDEAGEWIAFSNVFFNTDTFRNGARSMLMFGPFTGNPDASGVWQNVDASPGDVFEASVWVQTLANDSIKGNANFSSMKIEFLDANGDIIPGLGEFTGANGKENIIIEGRDPDCPEDTWVQRHVNAVAPAGTAKARVTMLFVQIENQGGACYYDDLELVKLTPVAGVVTVAPDSFDVVNGTYVAGGLAELSESDNADLGARRSNTDIQSRVFVEVKSTSPVASPTLLSFTLEASVFARTNVVQSIDLFNYTTNSWEEIDTRNASRFSDSTATVEATGDLSRFVEPGTMCIEARARYQSPVIRQRFTANIDQMIWMIQ